MSRWTMPAACAALSAEETWIAIVQCLAERQTNASRREPLTERLALDVLHRDVAAAVTRLAEVVDVADVRMTEC